MRAHTRRRICLHVLSCLLNKPCNATSLFAQVNHSRSAETAVAMPTEAANQSLAVRAYSGVGKIEPFQVFLLQPRGQLHTGADDALALPGYGYSTFTGPNIYLNPQVRVVCL